MSKFISDGTGILVENELQVQSTAPNVTIKNTTAEDTDTGRESDIDFVGVQSGGEVTTLARIRVSHDGSSDDEKGRLDITMNDGNDGATPSISALRILSTGVVSLFGLLQQWTPALGGTATYTLRYGYYIKIGKLIFIEGTIQVNALGTGSASTISGLPETAGATGSYGTVFWSSAAIGYTALICNVASGATTIIFYGATAAAATLVPTSPFASGSLIQLSITYVAA